MAATAIMASYLILFSQFSFSFLFCWTCPRKTSPALFSSLNWPLPFSTFSVRSRSNSSAAETVEGNRSVAVRMRTKHLNQQHFIFHIFCSNWDTVLKKTRRVRCRLYLRKNRRTIVIQWCIVHSSTRSVWSCIQKSEIRSLLVMKKPTKSPFHHLQSSRWKKTLARSSDSSPAEFLRNLFRTLQTILV